MASSIQKCKTISRLLQSVVCRNQLRTLVMLSNRLVKEVWPSKPSSINQQSRIGKDLNEFTLSRSNLKGLNYTDAKVLSQDIKQRRQMQAVDALDTDKPGHVHCKRPYKYHCIAGKTYFWCTCGWSRTQPFCDATHANQKMKISNRPFRFDCNETKDYWFCQCKHTKSRPFCDGTHNTKEVQEKNSTITWKY